MQSEIEVLDKITLTGTDPVLHLTNYTSALSTGSPGDIAIKSGNLIISNSSGFYATLNISGLTANRTLTFPDLTDNIVTDTSTSTLTNKTINVTNSVFTNGTHTSQFNFVLSANRVYTFPNLTDTIMTNNSSGTITNKTFNYTSCDFGNGLFTAQFNIGGLTSSRSYVFPDLDDNILTDTSTSTMTNKTLFDPVMSNKIKFNSATIAITDPMAIMMRNRGSYRTFSMSTDSGTNFCEFNLTLLTASRMLQVPNVDGVIATTGTIPNYFTFGDYKNASRSSSFTTLSQTYFPGTNAIGSNTSCSVTTIANVATLATVTIRIQNITTGTTFYSLLYANNTTAPTIRTLSLGTNASTACILEAQVATTPASTVSTRMTSIVLRFN